MKDQLIELLLVLIIIGSILTFGLFAVNEIASNWEPEQTNAEYMEDMQDLSLRGY